MGRGGRESEGERCVEVSTGDGAWERRLCRRRCCCSWWQRGRGGWNINKGGAALAAADCGGVPTRGRRSPGCTPPSCYLWWPFSIMCAALTDEDDDDDDGGTMTLCVGT